MLHLTNCPLHVQPARSSTSQPCCPTPGTKYIESLKKQDYSDHWASSRKYPQRSAVSNVDEVGKTIRMGKGQSTHMTLIQCIFLHSQMKFKPSLLRSNQRERIYPKGELTPTADFTCTQVLYVAEQMPSLRRTLGIFRWERVSKTCTKQIFMVYKYTQAHSSSSLHRAETPTTKCLATCQTYWQSKQKLGFFSQLRIARPCSLFLLLLIFIPPFLLHLLPRARGLSAVSSYWKHASLFGLKGQSQLVCTKSLMQKSPTIT